jgi:hypothetical protein
MATGPAVPADLDLELERWQLVLFHKDPRRQELQARDPRLVAELEQAHLRAAMVAHTTLVAHAPAPNASRSATAGSSTTCWCSTGPRSRPPGAGQPERVRRPIAAWRSPRLPEGSFRATR